METENRIEMEDDVANVHDVVDNNNNYIIFQQRALRVIRLLEKICNADICMQIGAFEKY